MSKLREILRTADYLVGVGPRGFKAHYLQVLVTGRMIDPDAMMAFERFESLGKAYLSASMPPWLRRTLGGGCLTPLCKDKMVDGVEPDARPVNANDYDVSAWKKASQQIHTPFVRAAVEPQQLGVGVSGLRRDQSMGA